MFLLFQYDVSLSVSGVVKEAVDFIVQKATKKIGKLKFTTTHGGTNPVFQPVAKICSAAKQLPEVYYRLYIQSYVAPHEPTLNSNQE